ncbi:MAG TPA: cytochrome c oxidase assembly protein [Sphingomicrobium sp.]|nr:cytochrome c oxidase assembly protein [Sphingomicrobium sp.]
MDLLPLNDIIVAVVIALLLASFAVAWMRLPMRRNGRRPVAGWRASLFVLAMLILAAVLLPPFDDLADAHFSAHMAQHLVLLVVAPPLLAASQAQLVFLNLLPLAARRRVGRSVAHVPGMKFAAHHSSTIWFVCLSSIAILWFWHLPEAYNWAQRSEAVHDAEHLLFIITETAFWRVILFRRERELRRAGAALILVAMSVQGGLLAAIITFAGKPMYMPYATNPYALADQALGGVMMWVIAGLVYLGAFVVLFVQALQQEPRSGRSPLRA